MRQKGFAPILIILVVLIAIGGAYYLGGLKGNILPAPTQTPVSVATNGHIPATVSPTNPTADPYPNWNTYKDTRNRFSFKYPSEEKIEKSQNTVGIYGLDFNLFEVKELETNETEPLSWWDKQTDLKGYKKECYKIANTTIPGSPKAIVLTHINTPEEVCAGPSMGTDIVTTFKGLLFKINYEGTQLSTEILSTFKFTQ